MNEDWKVDIILTVNQDNQGLFSCTRNGDAGACIMGRGVSVLEAVGEWAIQSGIVTIKCSPPALLREYAIATDYKDLKFDKSPCRE